MRISGLRSSSINNSLQSRRLKIKIFSILQKTSRQLSKSFVGSSKLRIWQTYDRSGKVWWHVFDPQTGRHNSVSSEEKLRAWIDLTYPNEYSEVDF